MRAKELVPDVSFKFEYLNAPLFPGSRVVRTGDSRGQKEVPFRRCELPG